MSGTKVPLAVSAAVALAVAAWVGFARYGILPAPPLGSAADHGALIVSGAIATLIGLERAIAMLRRWPFVVPALSAASALAAIVGLPAPAPALLATAAAALFVLVTAVGAPSSPRPSVAIMTAGAACWLGGALLWAQGTAPVQQVPWWIAFLVLTITAERMELASALRPSRGATLVVAGAAAAVGAGTVLTLVDLAAGVRVAGAGLAVLAAWLLLRDRPPAASRRLPLPRFIATAIAVAYGWLGVGGVLMATFDGVPAGWRYDAMIHVILAGFVLSMIVAHAPIVLPAVLGVTVVYRRLLWLPLALLTASVLVRSAGDAVESAAARNAGAVGIGLAVAALGATIATSARARRRGAARAPAV